MTDFLAEPARHAYPYLEEVLPGFHRARAVVKGAGDSLAPLGFVGAKQEFYRWANRLRLAASFGGLHLKGFTEDTAMGYDALTQVFFTWSAFERYADLANDRAPYRTLFAHHPRTTVRDLAALCRMQDPEHKLVEFLISQALLPVHMTYLARYRDGHDFSVLTLAACIRHIFAHGHLTASPYRLPSASLTVICCALNDFLLGFMRTDLIRRVTLAEASIGIAKSGEPGC